MQASKEDRLIGKRIRQRRRAMGLTLAEVATMAELSPSLLSQVERGITQPSITTLRKLANVLNVPIFFFLLEPHTPSPVVRKAERESLQVPGSNLAFELITPDLNRAMEVIVGRLEPGSMSCDSPLTHPGEECMLVIQGRMRVELGAEAYELEEGDSIYYFASVPHRTINIGDEDLVFVSAMTPPEF